MSDWGQVAAGQVDPTYGTGTVQGGGPGGAVNSKSAWTESLASTPFEITGFALQFEYSYASGVPQISLVDIGVGSAGNEVVLLPDIGYVSNANTASIRQPNSAFFPVYCAAGQRLAFRAAASVANGVSVAIILFSNPGASCCSDMTAYGADVSNSRGTALATGAAAVYGSWTEFCASTPTPIKGVSLHMSAAGSSYWEDEAFWDVGIGGSGSEVVLFTTHNGPESVDGISVQHSPFFPVDIPAGTRLSLRIWSAIGSRTYYPILYTYA